MISSFFLSYKLKNTYRVNSIIYSIKQLPLIGKLLPNSLYKNKFLKILANIVSAIIELCSIFLGKALYISIMIYAMIQFFDTDPSNTFLHIFTFLTLCGGLLNTYMFNPSKDKYYAMMIMNMDARKYTLSNYYYCILKVIVGFLPFTIIFGKMCNVNLIICIFLPLFVSMVKMNVNYYCIYKFKKNKKTTNENLPTKVVWGAIALCLLLAYGLPYLNIVISNVIFYIIFGVSILTGVYSTIKIHKFNDYKRMYKQILTPDNVYMVEKQSSSQAIKNNTLKQIELDKNFTSNKSGFSFFHELFVKRHKKILIDAVKKQSYVILIIIMAVLIFTKVNGDFAQRTNNLMLTYLPYFVFIMYLINRGTVLTQALFMNCDHSMLTYRIYRTPKVILGLFKERLKTLIGINLIPATIIAIGLPLILYVSGGTDNILNYVVLFVSIIAMSIFFSVHYLVMYYLLQPYNIDTEIKSSTYKVVQALTYIVCYNFIGYHLSTMSFGIACIAFCIIYSLVSLILVYKLAPKTFKLRI